MNYGSYSAQTSMTANNELDREKMRKLSRDLDTMGDDGRPKKPIRIGRIILGLLLAVVILFAAALLIATLTEYRPKDVEAVTPPTGERTAKVGMELTVVSYNTGYAALGKDEDFFMDGGESTRPSSSSVVNAYMTGIASELKRLHADIIFLQEVDTNSKRSYGIDQFSFYERILETPGDFAYNFKSIYTPYPLNDMLGKVSSGLAVFTKFKVESAERIQLPVPFSWPMRMFNLKRCLLVNRIPVEGTDKELVTVDLHLEAYDDGEGKIAQTKQLYEFLEAEYKKGNYVIAAGDFNQTFPGAKEFPEITPGSWMPGTLENDLPEGFSFVFDPEEPTCRLLDKPYRGNEDPQYYIIDGYIISSNLTVESVEVINTGFANSDHRPVKLVFTIGE